MLAQAGSHRALGFTNIRSGAKAALNKIHNKLTVTIIAVFGNKTKFTIMQNLKRGLERNFREYGMLGAGIHVRWLVGSLLNIFQPDAH